MSRTKQTYSAPTLTYYGKLAELTQAGSTILFQTDITSDGNDEQFWDTNGDGKTDVVVVPKTDGSGSTQFPLTSLNLGIYDSDGDGSIDLGLVDDNDDGKEDYPYVVFGLWEDRD